VACLTKEVDLSTLSHVIITHFGPNRIPTLAAVLEQATQVR
jgi:flavorubredoxin